MEDLLKLAKEDLEIANLLYNNKKYSNSLYHYHQSVEKSIKYIGLSIGGITTQQLNKEISHDPINAFKLLFKYFKGQSNGLIPDIDPHLFTNAKKIIDSGSEKEVVNGAWNMIQSICNEAKIIHDDQFPTAFEAVCDYIKKIAPAMDLGLDKDPYKKLVAITMEKEAVNTIILINYGMKILQVLLMNSLICSKFKPDNFRYPSNELGNPVEYFNENNALIMDLPLFMKSMDIPIEFAGKIKWGKK
ncbi:HEPN domain protein [Paludibacter propionicigenes WB4]|uniref:HEPN domain protein n=1 Tax=Paludibacter propionicigenes (strain DSM 17365 / JCM 13257 / WB4) TaxID=694427 RepID=E4T1M5_PALPW|nr:HEPN domain-containing protein [Paludibacter propionicigenes]ADQ78619.1 HEPN domain protein [Paludibacter propionicigenes WB4]